MKIISQKSVSISVEDDSDIDIIRLSTELENYLVQNPICGPSDYTDLPGAENHAQSSWRQFSPVGTRYGQRRVISEEARRKLGEARQRKKLKEEGLKRKREEILLNKAIKRKRTRHLKESELDPSYSDTKESEGAGSDDTDSSPNIIISSPSKKKIKNRNLFTDIGRLSKAKKKLSLPNDSDRVHVNNTNAEGLNKDSAKGDVYDSTNAVGVNKNSNRNANKDCDKTKDDGTDCDVDNLNHVRDFGGTNDLQDDSVENLDKPQQPFGLYYPETLNKRAPLKTVLVKSSPRSNKKSKYEDDDVWCGDDDDKSVWTTVRHKTRKSSPKQVRTRRKERKNYSEMDEGDGNFGEDEFLYCPSSSTKSGRKVIPVSRKLEEAIVSASMAKSGKRKKKASAAAEDIAGELNDDGGKDSSTTLAVLSSFHKAQSTVTDGLLNAKDNSEKNERKDAGGLSVSTVERSATALVKDETKDSSAILSLGKTTSQNSQSSSNVQKTSVTNDVHHDSDKKSKVLSLVPSSLLHPQLAAQHANQKPQTLLSSQPHQQPTAPSLLQLQQQQQTPLPADHHHFSLQQPFPPQLLHLPSSGPPLPSSTNPFFPLPNLTSLQVLQPSSYNSPVPSSASSSSSLSSMKNNHFLNFPTPTPSTSSLSAKETTILNRLNSNVLAGNNSTHANTITTTKATVSSLPPPPPVSTTTTSRPVISPYPTPPPLMSHLSSTHHLPPPSDISMFPHPHLTSNHRPLPPLPLNPLSHPQHPPINLITPESLVITTTSSTTSSKTPSTLSFHAHIISTLPLSSTVFRNQVNTIPPPPKLQPHSPYALPPGSHPYLQQGLLPSGHNLTGNTNYSTSNLTASSNAAWSGIITSTAANTALINSKAMAIANQKQLQQVNSVHHAGNVAPTAKGVQSMKQATLHQQQRQHVNSNNQSALEPARKMSTSASDSTMAVKKTKPPVTGGNPSTPENKTSLSHTTSRASCKQSSKLTVENMLNDMNNLRQSKSEVVPRKKVTEDKTGSKAQSLMTVEAMLETIKTAHNKRMKEADNNNSSSSLSQSASNLENSGKKSSSSHHLSHPGSRDKDNSNAVGMHSKAVNDHHMKGNHDSSSPYSAPQHHIAKSPHNAQQRAAITQPAGSGIPPPFGLSQYPPPLPPPPPAHNHHAQQTPRHHQQRLQYFPEGGTTHPLHPRLIPQAHSHSSSPRSALPQHAGHPSDRRLQQLQQHKQQQQQQQCHRPPAISSSFHQTPPRPQHLSSSRESSSSSSSSLPPQQNAHHHHYLQPQQQQPPPHVFQQPEPAHQQGRQQARPPPQQQQQQLPPAPHHPSIQQQQEVPDSLLNTVNIYSQFNLRPNPPSSLLSPGSNMNPHQPQPQPPRLPPPQPHYPITSTTHPAPSMPPAAYRVNQDYPVGDTIGTVTVCQASGQPTPTRVSSSSTATRAPQPSDAIMSKLLQNQQQQQSLQQQYVQNNSLSSHSLVSKSTTTTTTTTVGMVEMKPRMVRQLSSSSTATADDEEEEEDDGKVSRRSSAASPVDSKMSLIIHRHLQQGQAHTNTTTTTTSASQGNLVACPPPPPPPGRQSNRSTLLHSSQCDDNNDDDDDRESSSPVDSKMALILQRQLEERQAENAKLITKPLFSNSERDSDSPLGHRQASSSSLSSSHTTSTTTTSSSSSLSSQHQEPADISPSKMSLIVQRHLQQQQQQNHQTSHLSSHTKTTQPIATTKVVDSATHHHHHSQARRLETISITSSFSTSSISHPVDSKVGILKNIKRDLSEQSEEEENDHRYHEEEDYDNDDDDGGEEEDEETREPRDVKPNLKELQRRVLHQKMDWQPSLSKGSSATTAAVSGSSTTHPLNTDSVTNTTTARSCEALTSRSSTSSLSSSRTITISSSIASSSSLSSSSSSSLTAISSASGLSGVSHCATPMTTTATTSNATGVVASATHQHLQKQHHGVPMASSIHHPSDPHSPVDPKAGLLRHIKHDLSQEEEDEEGMMEDDDDADDEEEEDEETTKDVKPNLKELQQNVATDTDSSLPKGPMTTVLPNETSRPLLKQQVANSITTRGCEVLTACSSSASSLSTISSSVTSPSRTSLSLSSSFLATASTGIVPSTPLPPPVVPATTHTTTALIVTVAPVPTSVSSSSSSLLSMSASTSTTSSSLSSLFTTSDSSSLSSGLAATGTSNKNKQSGGLQITLGTSSSLLDLITIKRELSTCEESDEIDEEEDANEEENSRIPSNKTKKLSTEESYGMYKAHSMSQLVNPAITVSASSRTCKTSSSSPSSSSPISATTSSSSSLLPPPQALSVVVPVVTDASKISSLIGAISPAKKPPTESTVVVGLIQSLSQLRDRIEEKSQLSSSSSLSHSPPLPPSSSSLSHEQEPTLLPSSSSLSDQQEPPPLPPPSSSSPLLSSPSHSSSSHQQQPPPSSPLSLSLSSSSSSSLLPYQQEPPPTQELPEETLPTVSKHPAMISGENSSSRESKQSAPTHMEMDEGDVLDTQSNNDKVQPDANVQIDRESDNCNVNVQASPDNSSCSVEHDTNASDYDGIQPRASKSCVQLVDGGGAGSSSVVSFKGVFHSVERNQDASSVSSVPKSMDVDPEEKSNEGSLADKTEKDGNSINICDNTTIGVNYCETANVASNDVNENSISNNDDRTDSPDVAKSVEGDDVLGSGVELPNDLDSGFNGDKTRDSVVNSDNDKNEVRSIAVCKAGESVQSFEESGRELIVYGAEEGNPVNDDDDDDDGKGGEANSACDNDVDDSAIEIKQSQSESMMEVDVANSKREDSQTVPNVSVVSECVSAVDKHAVEKDDVGESKGGKGDEVGESRLHDSMDVDDDDDDNDGGALTNSIQTEKEFVNVDGSLHAAVETMDGQESSCDIAKDVGSGSNSNEHVETTEETVKRRPGQSQSINNSHDESDVQDIASAESVVVECRQEDFMEVDDSNNSDGVNVKETFGDSRDDQNTTAKDSVKNAADCITEQSRAISSGGKKSDDLSSNEDIVKLPVKQNDSVCEKSDNSSSGVKMDEVLDKENDTVCKKSDNLSNGLEMDIVLLKEKDSVCKKSDNLNSGVEIDKVLDKENDSVSKKSDNLSSAVEMEKVLVTQNSSVFERPCHVLSCDAKMVDKTTEGENTTPAVEDFESDSDVEIVEDETAGVVLWEGTGAGVCEGEPKHNSRRRLFIGTNCEQGGGGGRACSAGDRELLSSSGVVKTEEDVIPNAGVVDSKDDVAVVGGGGANTENTSRKREGVSAATVSADSSNKSCGGLYVNAESADVVEIIDDDDEDDNDDSRKTSMRYVNSVVASSSSKDSLSDLLGHSSRGSKKDVSVGLRIDTSNNSDEVVDLLDDDDVVEIPPIISTFTTRTTTTKSSTKQKNKAVTSEDVSRNDGSSTNGKTAPTATTTIITTATVAQNNNDNNVNSGISNNVVEILSSDDEGEELERSSQISKEGAGSSLATSADSVHLHHPSSRMSRMISGASDDAVSSRSSHSPLSSPSGSGGVLSKSIQALGLWTKDQVARWLADNKLDKICLNLTKLDGPGLQRMAFEYHRNPEVFYVRVKKSLGLTLFQTLVIERSLKSLIYSMAASDS